jgi:hypothetical protein
MFISHMVSYYCPFRHWLLDILAIERDFVYLPIISYGWTLLLRHFWQWKLSGWPHTHSPIIRGFFPKDALNPWDWNLILFFLLWSIGGKGAQLTYFPQGHLSGWVR